jgi:hypothetical protein
MDEMDKWKMEREAVRNEEKRKLLAISDFDAEKLPTPERYQRMRYQRENEAAVWLEEERRKQSFKNATPATKRYAKTKGRIIYERD